MKINCPKCAVSYEFDESLLKGARTRLRCSACEHLFSLVSVTNGMLREDAFERVNSRKGWQLRLADGSIHKFVDLVAIQEGIFAGRITASDYISLEGSEQWRQLSELVEFVPLFQGSRPPKPIYSAEPSVQVSYGSYGIPGYQAQQAGVTSESNYAAQNWKSHGKDMLIVFLLGVLVSLGLYFLLFSPLS